MVDLICNDYLISSILLYIITINIRYPMWHYDYLPSWYNSTIYLPGFLLLPEANAFPKGFFNPYLLVWFNSNNTSDSKTKAYIFHINKIKKDLSTSETILKCLLVCWVCIILQANTKFGEIPYTAHGAQMTPPLIFNFCLFFVFLLISG